MTNVFRQKNLKCYEWTVNVPTTASTLVSDTFKLKNRKCNLELSMRWDDILYCCLYFKSSGELQSTVNMTLRVQSDGSTLYIQSIASFKSVSNEIWRKVRHQLPGSLITFEVTIHEDVSIEDKSLKTGLYWNADGSVEGLSKDMSKLLESGLNYDTEIKCGKHSIKTHKIILYARSDVFKAMLESSMLKGQTGVVEIQDMDFGYLQEFIKYLYTDVLSELNFEKAKALYEAADKYAVRSLFFRCSEFLQNNLTQENSCQCFALADAHSDEMLKDSVISYMVQSKIYLKDELWSPFCEIYPKVAIDVYKLSHKNTPK